MSPSSIHIFKADQISPPETLGDKALRRFIRIVFWIVPRFARFRRWVISLYE